MRIQCYVSSSSSSSSNKSCSICLSCTVIIPRVAFTVNCLNEVGIFKIKKSPFEILKLSISSWWKSNNQTLSVCLSSIHFMIFFCCIFLTLTLTLFWPKTSPSSIFQVLCFTSQGKVQASGRLLSLRFFIKHSFHIMFRLQFWREMLVPCQLLSHLTQTWTFPFQQQLFWFFFPAEFDWILRSAQSSFHVTDLSVFLCTHQTCISNGFEKQSQNKTHTKVFSYTKVFSTHNFSKVYNKELTVCTLLCLVCNHKPCQCEVSCVHD